MSPDASGVLSHKNEREQKRKWLIDDLAGELQQATEAAALAVLGLAKLLDDGLVPGPQKIDGTRYAADHACSVAERLAALAENRPCRWHTDATEEEVEAIDARDVP